MRAASGQQTPRSLAAVPHRQHPAHPGLLAGAPGLVGDVAARRPERRACVGPAPTGRTDGRRSPVDRPAAEPYPRPMRSCHAFP